MAVVDSASDIRVLSLQIDHLHESMDAMKEAMCSMAEAVNKLAIVEDRQSQANDRLGKIDETISKLDDRLRTLEVSEPMQTTVTDWVLRAMWALAAAAVMFVAAKAGLI